MRIMLKCFWSHNTVSDAECEDKGSFGSEMHISPQRKQYISKIKNKNVYLTYFLMNIL